MAEAAIEPWVTEAGPVEAVAPATVSTVAFLTTVFAIEALGAACGGQFGETEVGPPTHGPQRRHIQEPGDRGQEDPCLTDTS